MKNFLLLLNCFFLLTIYYPIHAKQRLITSEDFYNICQISDCQISPDGKTIAYAQTKVDKAKNNYISNIWIIPVKGGVSKQLTTSPYRDISPRWSPDSRYIAFVSNRSGKNQIWMIPVDGGEAWAITNLEAGASYPVWAPDATRIAFLSRVNEIDKTPGQESDSKIAIIKGKEYATDVKIIKDLKYRENMTYFNDQFTHIFIISFATNKITQLTKGPYNDSSPAWSPGSKYIAFASNREGDQFYDNNTDIFIVNVENGKLQQMTSETGSEESPVWSADGNTIYYIGRTEPNNYSIHSKIFSVNFATHKIKNLIPDFDNTVNNIQLSENGKNMCFLSPEQGNVNLYTIKLKHGNAQKVITGKQQIQHYNVSTGKQIVYIASNNTNPSDLFVTTISGKKIKKLTDINKNFLDNIILSEPDEIHYPGFQSRSIHGWIMHPPSFSSTQKYPVIVEIHGGPHWHYGNRWFQEFQLLAAQGYVVFYCNPRQSTGYGQEFTHLGVGEWGIGDYHDIMNGLNIVIKKGYIDTTKMGVIGGSYGGYLTNWIIGHTGRFKAAVTQRSLSNLISFYGTTDIQNFIEYEFGKPWEHFDKLLYHSPISYVQNIKTPLLILHSELDYRVPIGQAEELFTYLKRKNVDVKFIRYPDEGHNLSRTGQPVHRVDRYNRIIDWFNKYLK